MPIHISTNPPPSFLLLPTIIPFILSHFSPNPKPATRSASMAAGKENCVKPPPRQAKKRAAEAIAAAAAEQRPTKKRVVLGELSNFPVKVVEEIAAESKDPQLYEENYAADINAYLRKMEAEERRRPSPDYIEKVQKDVTAVMRGVLVDWLVEVAEEYKLLPTTLYLSVSYLDRFLSKNPIVRKRLQLLGVASMLIASKYEEIKPPHVKDFCYITENTYTKQELVKMEFDVLTCLKYEMGNPTAKAFLPQLTRFAAKEFDLGGDSKMELECLGDYLGELSLLDYKCVKFLPSLVAAAAVFLGKYTLCPGSKPWSDGMRCCSGYKAEDLKECVVILHELQLGRKGKSLVAVRDKYSEHRFKCVSKFSSPHQIPTHYFLD